MALRPTGVLGSDADLGCSIGHGSTWLNTEQAHEDETQHVPFASIRFILVMDTRTHSYIRIRRGQHRRSLGAAFGHVPKRWSLLGGNWSGCGERMTKEVHSSISLLGNCQLCSTAISARMLFLGGWVTRKLTKKPVHFQCLTVLYTRAGDFSHHLLDSKLLYQELLGNH